MQVALLELAVLGEEGFVVFEGFDCGWSGWSVLSVSLPFGELFAALEARLE